MGAYLAASESTAPLYVESFGYESDGSLAHWGPGQRKFAILHYIVSGKGFFNGHAVSAGQGFVIRKNELHEYHSSTDDPWNYFWVIINGSDANATLQKVHPNPDGIFRWDFAEALQTLIHHIFLHKTTLSPDRALGYFYLLLSCHQEAGPRSEAPAQHIAQAKRFMNLHYMHRITIEEVAQSIPIHSRYLCRLFKESEGISPKAYLNRLRLHRAQELLQSSDLSISQIAASVGYENVLEFSRFFSSNLHVSPTAYRNSPKK